MSETMTRFHQLLADGYRVEDIESDRDAIETVLRRGTHVVVLKLRRGDAEELLLASAHGVTR